MKASAQLNPAVDAYIARSAPFAQPILHYLRETVHTALPDVQEEIKWRMPFFTYRGVILCNMAAFKAHANFGIWGKEITARLNAEGIATDGAMGSFGRLTTVKELPPRKQLAGYLKSAAGFIADGTRTRAWERPKKAAKPPVEIPGPLAIAFKKNKAAGKNFAAMAPSCQREYADWITSAKREATRDERTLTAVQWISEGRKRHWKYENC